LEQRGLMENTLILGWSDHGEQLFEHDALGHGSNLYNETNDGIAFFSGAGLQPRSYPLPSSHLDLAPTLLNGMGLPVPTSMQQAPLSWDQEEQPRFSLVWPKDSPPVSSVELGAWKLIYTWNGQKELYQRELDPYESKDLNASYPEKVDALWELLLPHVQEQATLISDVPIY